jgi:hypothetical protein
MMTIEEARQYWFDMYKKKHDELAAANKEMERLKQSIRTTLENNRHLADGEDCTLIELKRAMKGEWE